MERFPGKKIVVIGDVMLDGYIHGSVSRTSPEAPIPVVSFEKMFYEIGGAGNLASNIASLGGKACLFGFVGKDSEAEILKRLLEIKGIEYFFDDNSMTTYKERIIGNGQQITRIDREETSEKIFSDETKKILFEKAMECDRIVISDYAKGAVSADLLSFLGIFKSKIIIGPKPENKHLYPGVYLIVPNKKEAFEMSGVNQVKEALHKLREKLNSNIIITLGDEGIILFSDREIHVPTYAKEVYDVSGARDSLLAAISIALSSDSSLEEAAIFGNHAVGIAVEKKGTYSVSWKELEFRIFSDEKKLIEFEELRALVEDYKKKKKKIVWTNGCFDILHTGHVDYLKKAKKLGDVLVVGLDSDDSIKKLKGLGRPINSESDRAEILSSLEFVDYVIIFQFGAVKNYLRDLQPHVYVKGGDYNIDTINQEERRIVEFYGGQIVIIPPVPDKSTTKTIEKIQKKLE